MELKLVIADSDEDYLKGLCEYLVNQVRELFYINSFTKVSDLREFIKKEEISSDILLIEPEFYQRIKETNDAILKKMGTVIILQEGDNELDHLRCSALNKYQRGNKIVNDIVDIYKQNNKKFAKDSGKHKDCKVAAVFSPQGGGGKTTVAVGVSIQLACEGKSVFYLNIENTPSTNLFFESNNEENFSNVLYFIKQQKVDISTKINMAKCFDSNYGVYFFKPPDSGLDWNEVADCDVKRLLKELRKISKYDYIIVDMSSSLNKNNIAVLDNCDDIILVLCQGYTCSVKCKELLKNFELLDSITEVSLMEKIHYILNYYDADCSVPLEYVDLFDIERVPRIPYINKLLIPFANRCRIDMNCKFGTAVHRLVERL